ncbi:hypothetical protein BOW53_04395 [Solemya pervernicosa gill symbiont]|uniref:Translation initiation factor 2 n=2 Tax=Gammaproteobacteria incertae sedis TaxID=118884 RepID=A0A1T2L8F1_9GAMM|nr:hypothetical protein [Candidatus Reidiella endopervernicosa]OOZ41361.1 hypothetical protein BOW53_04395 [Solemya pervernicosa gill symbiont]QKQ27739.1 hypothetical protein HUE57_16685 [Candidatus Reidiella endopervernicosa]
MSNQRTEEESIQNSQTVRIITESMGLLRAEMETIDKVAVKVAAKTTLIFRSVLALLGIITIYLVYLVYIMATHMGSMNSHLETMYGQFGIMADNMQKITSSVQSINYNVQGIPAISSHMTNMNSDVASMLASVHDINVSFSGMNNDVANIHIDTAEMSQHFNTVNNAVNHMRYNVNQISNPLTPFW